MKNSFYAAVHLEVIDIDTQAFALVAPFANWSKEEFAETSPSVKYIGEALRFGCVVDQVILCFSYFPFKIGYISTLQYDVGYD